MYFNFVVDTVDDKLVYGTVDKEELLELRDFTLIFVPNESVIPDFETMLTTEWLTNMLLHPNTAFEKEFKHNFIREQGFVWFKNCHGCIKDCYVGKVD